MMRSRSRGVLACGMLGVSAVILLAGCTPEEEQAIREAVNMALEEAINQSLDFVLSFGRQGLAAFLF